MQVDPHKIDLQPKPRSEDDLFVNADGQWLLGYDNLSTLDQHWSDAFCRIATGSGYRKRKLYTDRDTAQFQVARPQIVTCDRRRGAAPDLLDRSLLAQMPELGDAAGRGRGPGGRGGAGAAGAWGSCSTPRRSRSGTRARSS